MRLATTRKYDTASFYDASSKIVRRPMLGTTQSRISMKCAARYYYLLESHNEFTIVIDDTIWPWSRETLVYRRHDAAPVAVIARKMGLTNTRRHFRYYTRLATFSVSTRGIFTMYGRFHISVMRDDKQAKNAAALRNISGSLRDSISQKRNAQHRHVSVSKCNASNGRVDVTRR